jgi:DNA-binding NtrC family response regulator
MTIIAVLRRREITIRLTSGADILLVVGQPSMYLHAASSLELTLPERTTLSKTKPADQVKPALLLVDDDPLIVESLSLILQRDYLVYTAETRKQVIDLVHNLDAVPRLALIDLGLPPLPHQPDEGFALIGELLALNPDIKILVLSGQGEKTNIQHALTLGAVDFIPKPCDMPLLKTRLAHQIMILEAEQEQGGGEMSGDNLLGESEEIKALHLSIRQFAETPFPVLIQGESGSGKELVAEYLHDQGPRANAPFLTLNCAAISADLLEAQLFGHQKGAYTGATTSRAGFFEEAGEGTLFLDEIGDLPLSLQSKLLRVLENGEYYRLGETQPRYSSARIIAATNRDLREEVKAGRFRADLYHRLSVLTINVPPLRDREQDCLILLEHFKKLYAMGADSFTLEGDALECLKRYTFPGNVRELRNIVIRLCAKYPGKKVTAAELQEELESEITPLTGENLAVLESVEQELMTRQFRLDDKLSEWEHRYISAALNMSGGNLSKAARLLGINRTTLYSRIQRLAIETRDRV